MDMREMYNIERCSQGHNKNSSQERALQSTALMSHSRHLCCTGIVWAKLIHWSDDVQPALIQLVSDLNCTLN